MKSLFSFTLSFHGASLLYACNIFAEPLKKPLVTQTQTRVVSQLRSDKNISLSSFFVTNYESRKYEGLHRSQVPGLGPPYLSAFLDPVGSNVSQGANFATAGPTVRHQNTTIFQSGYTPISLGVESLQFSDFHRTSSEFREQGWIYEKLLPSENSFSQSLYTFDIGQNDVTSGYRQNMTTDQVKATIPDVLPRFFYVSKGGRSFWILNTCPLGCLSNILDRFLITTAQVCATPFNQVAQFFNGRLGGTVGQLRKDLPSATITYADVYPVKYALTTQAKRLGFENPLLVFCGHREKYNYNGQKRCGSSRTTVNGKVVSFPDSCKNPFVRVSCDGVHYTEAANK